MSLCPRVVTYDGGDSGDMVQTKALRGLNSYDYTATWEMLTSEPPLPYSSARYNVALEEITMSDSTLVIFTTTYSNDATIEVTEDQKFKLRDGLTQLKTLCVKKADA